MIRKFFHNLSLFAVMTIPTTIRAQHLVFSGQQVGNGGDVVVCTHSPDNHYNGYYSLDYFLTQPRTPNPPELVQVHDWETWSQEFLTIMKEKNIFLAKRFETFLDYTANFYDFSRARIWIPSVTGLINLRDEHVIVRSLPTNCTNSPDGEPGANLMQAVIRETGVNFIKYNYDFDIMEELRLNYPLQHSFTMFHEWLWDCFNAPHDVRNIRLTNRLLHRKNLADMPKKEFWRSLLNLGLQSHCRGSS